MKFCKRGFTIFSGAPNVPRPFTDVPPAIQYALEDILQTVPEVESDCEYFNSSQSHLYIDRFVYSLWFRKLNKDIHVNGYDRCAISYFPVSKNIFVIVDVR